MLALDAYQTLAAAGLTLMLGALILRVVPAFARVNLPGPVLGGLCVAVVLALVRRDGALPIQFDTSLKDPLMVAFFTALGFGASYRLLRAGGPSVVFYLVACTVLAVLQNVLGAGLAWSFGLNPLAGVLAGSVTLTGGPGTGMAFAPAFEKAGVASAGTLALAAAMGGIVLGGLLGTPVATRLIHRHQLAGARPVGPTPTTALEGQAPTEVTTLRHVVVLLVAMWWGGYLSTLFTRWGITLPGYMGAMVVAAILRNADDRWGFFRLEAQVLERLGNLALMFFLALALMTLRLWELVHLAGPLAVMLLAQAGLMVLAAHLMFRLSGRDYDAAVMSAGLVGFMMGTTANAMANMDALTRRYGAAPRAYLVVPLVGACFIDFTNSLIITAALNLAR